MRVVESVNSIYQKLQSTPIYLMIHQKHSQNLFLLEIGVLVRL
ncbi:hypothetical protein J2S04_000012 [Alicyclobacillus tengchongensis]|uniref:Transposase n=1 Tax=Alicyclobacillus tolerans TaxID=90970 RepID=A0ABT9LS51_9BACL|nr:hypothetical protein [Alicyclobacillus tengchongensis]